MSAVFSARFLRSILQIQRPEEASRFLRQDRYWCPEVAEPLLTRVDELTPLQPNAALGLAEIALDLVKRIRNASRDLQAHAWCSLAGAQRAQGALLAAESSLRAAEPLVKSCEMPIQALFARQRAVLLIHQGHKDKALRTAQEAVRLERRLEKVPTKGLIVEGAVRYLRDEYKKSGECWNEILQNEDPASALHAIAMQNFAATLAKQPLSLEEVVEARKLLRQILERIKGVRKTPVRYIIWHTEGLFHLRLEEFGQAIDHFMQARSGFFRLEQMISLARVSADLIEALVKSGKLERARHMMERTAKQLAEYEEHTGDAQVFRLAMAQPIAEAAEFLRARLPAGGTQNATAPRTRPADSAESQGETPGLVAL